MKDRFDFDAFIAARQAPPDRVAAVWSILIPLASAGLLCLIFAAEAPAHHPLIADLQTCAAACLAAAFAIWFVYRLHLWLADW